MPGGDAGIDGGGGEWARENGNPSLAGSMRMAEWGWKSNEREKRERLPRLGAFRQPNGCSPPAQSNALTGCSPAQQPSQKCSEHLETPYLGWLMEGTGLRELRQDLDGRFDQADDSSWGHCWV